MIDLNTASPGDIVAQAETGPLSREMLAEYAQASGDLNPLHTDPAFARKAGFDDVIAHGMLGMALLGNLVADAAKAGRLRNLSARFAGIVPVETSLQCTAELERIEDGVAELKLQAINPDGKAVIEGRARVEV